MSRDNYAELVEGTYVEPGHDVAHKCFIPGCPVCNPPKQSDAEPVAWRTALLAAQQTLAAYQDRNPHDFVGDIHLPKVHALIDAALAQSDAEPVRWEFRTITAGKTGGGNWTLWLGDRQPELDLNFYEIRPLYAGKPE